LSKSEACDPKYVLQNIESIKRKPDKLDYIADRLEQCAITPAPAPKKKRGMSNYNCFSKVQYKKEKQIAEQENRKPISFKDMLKAKAWSLQSDKQKEMWRRHAKEGCLPRLWGE